MTVQLHYTTAPPQLPGPLSPRPQECTPWLDQLQRRLRERLPNPLLHTLAIVAVELRPHGDRYWAPGTERVAVVSLTPGVCGYESALRLGAGPRAEFERALADLCAVDRILLRPASPGRARLADALVVLGQLGGALGIIPFLPTSPFLVGAVAAIGAASAHAGYTFAPTEPC